ncbi:MAG: hypothetical protein CVT60_04945 [Actinobacteria bacterium HGW-Actinobacteria-10]|nr:MAG: hypothetical protein CVT60_04945 [Actinobacteria bacterium HGW-Actinobacteria-10]
MNVLEEIQAAATESSVPLPDLLRKCAILASRLKNNEFRTWVDHELNGYDKAEQVPAYRILSIQARGDFFGPFGSGLKNAPIPPSCLHEDLRHHAETTYIMQSVASLADLMDASDSDLRIPWPPDLTVLVAGDFYEDANLALAWKVISRGQIAGILDTVRNRILAFVLEIEAAAPDPVSWPSNSVPLPQEQVSQVFQTYIQGNASNVIVGSSEFSVSAVTVNAGDIDSLLAAMRSLGLSESEVAALKDAIERDGVAGTRTSLGKRVTKWIGEATAKASQGALKAGAAAAGGALVKWLMAYYGLG